MKISASLLYTDVLPSKRRLLSKIVKSKLFDNFPPNEVFSVFKKSGIEGVELLLPKIISKSELEEVKDMLDINKMKVFSVHQSLRFITRTNISEIRQLFDAAKIFDAKVIVLHMNTVGRQIFNKDYVLALHVLEKQYGVKVGFENREKYIGSAHNGYGWDEKKFPALMKTANFNMTLDVCHLGQSGGNIVNFFKNNKEKIVNIHLSDYKVHYLNNSLRPLRYKHLPLGNGSLPIKEFLATLKKEKYNGLLTLEINSHLEKFLESVKIVKDAS